MAVRGVGGAEEGEEGGCLEMEVMDRYRDCDIV